MILTRIGSGTTRACDRAGFVADMRRRSSRPLVPSTTLPVSGTAFQLLFNFIDREDNTYEAVSQIQISLS